MGTNAIKKLGFLICIVASAMSYSCEKNEESPQIAYYQFTQEDVARLPDYKEKQKMKFVDQNGDTAYLQITRFIKNIHSLYTEGMGFFSPYAASYFYYDSWEMEISGICKGKGFAHYLQYSRSPEDWEAAKKEIYKTFPSRFRGSMDFGLWNKKTPDNLYLERLIFPFGEPTTSLNIGAKPYTQVYKFDSQTETTWDTAHQQLPLVNHVFYDLKSGIIGYDDLDHQEWRLVE